MHHIHTSFINFSQDIDQHNDRRERLIKAGRDVTNLSKKTIFLLHRLMNDDSDALDERERARQAARSAFVKLSEVQKSFAAMKPDLEGRLFWRYQPQVSPGLQEYIEALSFTHYLEYGSLITFKQVQNTLVDADGARLFPLPISDYLLGLSDLTGELMRYAITTISHRGGQRRAADICSFVRCCKADFERFTPYVAELHKKQAVSSQSLQKIEDATYAITIRGSEFDLSQEALEDIVAQSVLTFSSADRHSHDEGML